MRYWDMTYGEIIAAIKGNQERQRSEMQVQAMLGYKQAQLIGSLVSKVLGGKHKTPTLAEAYPGIFPEELFEPKKQDWRIMKERIASHGERYKRKRGEQADNRRIASSDHGRNEST